MKLLYIVEDFAENGGVERIVSQKANIFSTQYNHDVTIVSVYRDNRNIEYSIDENVKYISLDVPFANKDKGKLSTLYSRLSTFIIAIRRVNHVINQINPDIIFFTTTLGALLLPWCRTKVRKVYESHTARRYTPFSCFFFLTELKADAIVCLTDGDANEYKIARSVEVIPNFIDEPLRLVNDYSVKKAIAVGRLEWVKGFDILIDCWKDVANEHPDWHLDIYGDGAMRANLQSQIDRLELQNQVTLCGRNEKIMEVYPQYSLHIMPSRYEGLPMALMEAQSCGLPSVVFYFKYGAHDIVTNGYNGMIVRQGDKKSFVNAIDIMMRSPKLRLQYGHNAIEVGMRYHKEKILFRWFELIRTIAK